MALGAEPEDQKRRVKTRARRQARPPTGARCGAGLKSQPFHNLRHACASFLLAQGVHPRVVMEMPGHSQIGITMNLYSHVAASLERDAADRIDALLAAL